VAGAAVAIGDDVEHLRDSLRGSVALYIGGMGARGRNFYNTLACRYGYEEAATRVQDLYLDGKKDEAAAAIPAELLEQISLIGSAGYVKERLVEFQAAGVTNLSIRPLGGDLVQVVDQLRSWID